MADSQLQARFVTIETGLFELGLEPYLWMAIDEIAQNQGIDWEQWVQQVIKRMPSNRTSPNRWVRSRILAELNARMATFPAEERLSEYGEYDETEIAPQHLILKNLRIGPKDNIEQILGEEGTEVVYKMDCHGFVVYAGYREGDPVLVIENEKVDGLSLVYQVSLKN
jgi:hypothetical protein